VYKFPKSRTRDAPLTFLADYRGYLQAYVVEKVLN